MRIAVTKAWLLTLRMHHRDQAKMRRTGMSGIRKASFGVGLAVAFAMVGLALPSATAMASSCGYYTNANGDAKYLNCVNHGVIIRVEHQKGHPGEDRCISGWEDRFLGPTTEIKWAWAIGGGAC
jgi:Family of unknown function (DUF6355)